MPAEAPQKSVRDKPLLFIGKQSPELPERIE
jgi:hypothetical protein